MPLTWYFLTRGNHKKYIPVHGLGKKESHFFFTVGKMDILRAIKYATRFFMLFYVCQRIKFMYEEKFIESKT